MKNLNLLNQIIRRGSGASLNLFRYTAMVVVLLTLGIGSAWGSTYYSKVTTSESPTGKGKVYVVAGSPFSGTATSATNSGSSQSQTYSLKATPTVAGYYFVNWTSTGTATLSFNSSTNASTTCSITATSESSNSPTTGNAQANWAEVTIGAGVASPPSIIATNNSTACTDYTGSITFSTKGDAKDDFYDATPPVANTGHGTFSVTNWEVASNGTVTVNYKFVGDGTYGGASGTRNRSTSGVFTLKSKPGNISNTCTVTASFPPITIATGEGTSFNATLNEEKQSTATFAVEYADDADDFTAEFSDETTGSTWGVDSISCADGVVTVTYTFNSTVADTHTATLTLTANGNAGGTSNTAELTAISKAKASDDASVTYNNTTTNYSTIAAAISAANSQPGAVVTLLRNIPSETTPSLSSPIEITGLMTLDLNSYTIARTGMADGSQQVITVNMSNAASVLTIKDSSMGHDGKISGTGGSNGNMLYAVCMEKGVLNFESGIVECTNTNSGDNAKATGIRVKNGCKLLMQGGTINATTSGNPARGIYATTTSSNAQMVVVSGGFINTKAANSSVGIDCESTDTPSSIDPDSTKANVILSGVIVDAQTTGTTEAIAVRTAAGVVLGITDGTYNATAKATTAYALQSSGYTAVLGGTFNATATTTTAHALRCEKGITAVRGGTFTATAEQKTAHGAYICDGAKLLTYGGTFKGVVNAMVVDGWATGTQVYDGGTLEAQGGTFIGEANNLNQSSEVAVCAAGIYLNNASKASYATISNATLQGKINNANLNGAANDTHRGAHGLMTRTTSPVTLTNCTISANSAHKYAFGVRSTNTPIDIKNSSISVTSSKSYNYGIYTYGTAAVTMSNSTVECTSQEAECSGAFLTNGTRLDAEKTNFNVTVNQSSATAVTAANSRGVNLEIGSVANLNGCVIKFKGNANYTSTVYGIRNIGTASIEDCTIKVYSVKEAAYALCGGESSVSTGVGSGKFYVSTGTTDGSTVTTGTNTFSMYGNNSVGKTYLYGGYYTQNNNLEKYLPAKGYAIETLPSGSTEYSEGYRYAIRATEDVGDPVCKIGSTPYTTLEEALEYASKNASTEMTIYMVKNYTLPAGDYVLPAKTTLLVPYKTGSGAGATTAVGTGKTGYVSSYVTPSLFRKLTFADGVKMTVFGTIEVSSEKYLVSSGYTGVPSGPYGQIVLDGNAHIDLEENSKLVAWGYVTGSGDINAKNKSSIYEMFQLLDMKGGGVTSQLINDSHNPKIFPITHYAYQNVEAAITYRPGSKAIGWTGAIVQSSNQVANNVMMVGNMNSGALFLMADEGESSDTWVKKHYNPATDRAEYTLNNTATLGSMNVNLTSINMASANYILPIASNMTITLKYGTMTITQNTYFMPGSILNIEKESTLTIPSGKELYFVDKNQWVKGYSPAQYVCVVPYSPSFNNGKGGKGSDYSPRKGLMSANTNLLAAELFAHGDIIVNGALYTTADGANIHSTDADAGKITFNAIAANKDFCQLNSTCGEGAGGPGGSPGGEKCGSLGKLGCTSGTCDCYYWNWNTWPCTSAQLKNSDNSFTSSVSGGAGTYVYKNGAWTKIAQEGCFVTETDGSGKHYYATPSDVVEVTRNADNSYRDVASGFRRFVWDVNCEWWEVETTPTAEGYYKAIKADHNGQYNYYEYNSTNDYWQKKNVTITWNIDGTTTNYTISYGIHPKYLSVNPTKDPTATDYYTWLGWTKGSTDGEFFAKDTELPVATENTTYYAYFETHKFEYTITFRTHDGAVLEAKRWAHGEVPTYEGTPLKPATAAKEYTHDGWSTTKNGSKVTIPAATTAATYYAHFAESDRKYTIQWVNYNGTVLKEEQVAYNTTPSKPTAPTRPNDTYYTYTFDTWSPAIATVTGDQTYTATYDYEKLVPKYTATFKNGTETVYTQNLKSGEVPVFDGTTPTKTADAQYTYTFDGWSTSNGGALAYALSDALPALTADVTYYAHFATTTNNYRIIWKSENGKVTLETDPTVPYGTTPSFDGATPTKDRVGKTGYEFDGWSASIGGDNLALLPNVTEDKVFYAHFLEGTYYNITFNAKEHGTAPAGYEVIGGSKLSAPEAPTETGYTFGGWYKESACANVWNFASDEVNSNTTLYAKWTVNTHKFAWNFDGGTPSGNYTEANNALAYGSAITYPTLSKTGYTFAGWSSNATSMPDADLTITASWTVNTHKLAWNFDGGTPSGNYTEANNALAYGSTITYPTLSKTGYTFNGWSSSATSMPDADLTITASWTPNTNTAYTVEHYWQNIADNEYTKHETVNMTGTTDAATAAVDKNYTGFEAALPFEQGTVAPDGSTVVKIYYNRKTYLIKWDVKLNGVQEAYKEETLRYGATPSYGTDPTKEQSVSQVYSFSGWTPTPYAVDKDQTYNGSFNVSPRPYTITFVNDNGVELWHSDFGYGSTPSYGGSDPVSSHTGDGYTYTHAGWKPAIADVSGEATYTAKYNRSAEAITVSTPETVTDNTVASTTTVENHGELTIEEAKLQSTTIIVESGGQLDIKEGASVDADVFIIQATTQDQEVTPGVTVEVQVSGEMTETGSKNLGAIYYDLTRKGGAEPFLARVWYAVAVPWAVEVPNYGNGGVFIKRGEEFIPQRLGATFDLLSYDGACRAQNGASANCWVYLEDEIDGGADAVMVPGKLYMIYLTEETSTIRFKKKAGEAIHTNTLTVSAYGDSGNDANWNGIANPATYRAYMNVNVGEGGLVQKFVPGTQPRDGGSYLPLDLDDKQAVGQPFFVQVDPSVGTEASVMVTRNNTPTLAPRRAQVTEEKEVRYAIGIAANGKLADRLYIQTAEEKEDKYVIGKDMSKMSVSSYVAQMWVERYGSKLCQNTMALTRDKAVYPLGIYAPQAGEYMIFAPTDMASGDNIYLTYDGRVIWNLTMAPYYATLEQGTTTNYGLRLIRSNAPAVTTGVDEVQSENAQCTKVIMDDHVYILRGEELYTITGQKAK